VFADVPGRRNPAIIGKLLLFNVTALNVFIAFPDTEFIRFLPYSVETAIKQQRSWLAEISSGIISLAFSVIRGIYCLAFNRVTVYK
jgi:hypothetical protein